MKKQVLFVCIHNSARSQMAEAFLNQLCPDAFEAQSAGIEPGKLNPVVVEAMREIGVDLSGNKTKSVSDFLGQGFDYVVTVCDETSAERCPAFPGRTQRLHWGFTDPSSFQGSHAEKLSRTREVRDTIKARIEEWCAEVCPRVAAQEQTGKTERIVSGRRTQHGIRTLLPRLEIGTSRAKFDQFALPADGEMVKGFEPIAQRHFRVAVEPVAQGYEVICRNPPQSYAICQMVHQLLRQILASDFRHY